jgi:hypothetical protein
MHLQAQELGAKQTALLIVVYIGNSWCIRATHSWGTKLLKGNCYLDATKGMSGRQRILQLQFFTHEDHSTRTRWLAETVTTMEELSGSMPSMEPLFPTAPKPQIQPGTEGTYITTPTAHCLVMILYQ